METIYKISDSEVKKVGDRQYEFIASNSTVDRDGEVIDVDGWDLKNFKRNPVIPWAHNYQNPPVARATRVWKHNGQLKNSIEFPPEGTYEFADTIERLVDAGYIKAQSVGFIPKEWEDGDGEKAPRRTYKKQELLEISLVPVPSNPDALRNAVDSGVITAKQYKTIKDTVQIICPHCSADRVEPKPELGKTVWQCCECGKTFDTTTKPEETDEFIRIPNPKDEKNHDEHKIRTMDIDKDKGITALYCVDCKIVKTYIFAKDKGWTMAKAKKWVEDHSKNFVILELEPDYLSIDEIAKENNLDLDKPISQEELKDEIDYLKDSIEDVGLSDSAREAALELVETIKRLTGNDIPDDINKRENDAGMNKEQIIEIIKNEVSEAIQKAQGKV